MNFKNEGKILRENFKKLVLDFMMSKEVAPILMKE